MYDTTLARDLLGETLEASQKVQERCQKADSVDDFLTKDGQIILDSICMQLIAIGEAIKKIDKLTNKQLLKNYKDINWKAIMVMRDILSHHYFDLNAETVYGVCQDDIQNLISTLELIIKDTIEPKNHNT